MNKKLSWHPAITKKRKFGEVIYRFLLISFFIGLVYWAFLAWKIGSWLMFASLILFPLAGFMGFWSLVFGTPEWVYYIFY